VVYLAKTPKTLKLVGDGKNKPEKSKDRVKKAYLRGYPLILFIGPSPSSLLRF
jgi:hypothetical protein